MHMLNDAKSWERLCGLGIREWIAQKKAAGQIRNIGFSFHGGTLQFKALVDAFDWDFCQIQFNYMDERSQAGIDGLNHAHEKGLPVIIMEPLRGGRLAGGLPQAARREFEALDPSRSPADWGLRWVWNHPQVTVVLSGMNDVSQVEENCRIASESLPGSLSGDELSVYGRALAAIHKSMKVGCTGCGYCQPCPRGVDIPTCFAAYNASYADGLISGMREYMMCTTLRKVRSNAGLCVKCGKCEQHCPQHIPIREKLDDVKKRLENPIYKIAAWGAPKVLKY
jgi:predicted aldo/keto reductase-like oxidoreductase